MAGKKRGKTKSMRRIGAGAGAAGGAGPTKPDLSRVIGTVTQQNYEFLKELWGSNGPALRDMLVSAAKQDELRDLLVGWNIYVDSFVKVMIVDIENARTHTPEGPIDPMVDKFYVLVLPPVPRKHPKEPGYGMSQGWSTAYYHAITDSYGM
jgi:hypothetical protein